MAGKTILRIITENKHSIHIPSIMKKGSVENISTKLRGVSDYKNLISWTENYGFGTIRPGMYRNLYLTINKEKALRPIKINKNVLHIDVLVPVETSEIVDISEFAKEYPFEPVLAIARSGFSWVGIPRGDSERTLFHKVKIYHENSLIDNKYKNHWSSFDNFRQLRYFPLKKLE